MSTQHTSARMSDAEVLANQLKSTKPSHPSKPSASRTGGTHCTPLDSNYGVLGKDDTFAKEEKRKGFGASWGEKLKGKISRF